MDERREGLPIGPLPEHRMYDTEASFTGEMSAFWGIVIELFMSYPGDEYDDNVPWQFREPGTDALARND